MSHACGFEPLTIGLCCSPHDPNMACAAWWNPCAWPHGNAAKLSLSLPPSPLAPSPGSRNQIRVMWDAMRMATSPHMGKPRSSPLLPLSFSPLPCSLTWISESEPGSLPLIANSSSLWCPPGLQKTRMSSGHVFSRSISKASGGGAAADASGWLEGPPAGARYSPSPPRGPGGPSRRNGGGPSLLKGPPAYG